jgi:hypothetical protein
MSMRASECHAHGGEIIVHTAFRPYVTTGIAIVGASVITVAPLAVPPSDLPSVEVSAVDKIRSVSADVELTVSLADLASVVPQIAALVVQSAVGPLPLPAQLKTLVVELANAGVPAVRDTVKLFTESLPQSALSLIAAGKFAHLLPLAVNTVYAATLTPIAPFAIALLEALPLPLGTQGGAINEFLKLAIQTPTLAATTVLTLFAQVIDDGLSPVAAFTGTFDAIVAAVTSAVESVEKIAALFGGALPFSALAAPEAPSSARMQAPAMGMPAIDDTNIIASEFDSSKPGAESQTVTIAVDTGVTSDAEPDDAVAREQLSEENAGSADEAVTANGATDLSDGNMAEPGVTIDSPSEDAGGSTPPAESTSDDQAEPSSDTVTGEDEDSAGDSEPARE